MPYLDGAQVVLPTADFFPDTFDATPQSVGALLDRIRAYTPLAGDVGLHLAFATPDAEGSSESGGSCSSGGCGTGNKGAAGSTRVSRHADGFGFVLDVRWGDSAPGLVAELTRATLGAVMLELGEDEHADDIAHDHDLDREMLAVACGFGAILLEASCVYKKACKGMSASRATHASTSALAMSTAAHLRVMGASASETRRHLNATQREAFNEALAWVDARPTLIEKLRDAPELIEVGRPEAEPARGLLARLFG